METLPERGSALPSGVAESESDLRAIYKAPSRGAVDKEIDRIDRHCRRFIELSPFLCLGTMGPESRGDVSPRGGEPGFVHVLDDNRIAIPDRPGNNRLDNIVVAGALVPTPGAAALMGIGGLVAARRRRA